MLIGGSPSKLFHLENFAENLKKNNIETKVVIDTEIYTGFPSKKISNWFESTKKLDKLISDFKPDMILVDRQRQFAKVALKYKIPLIIHLRGDYWSEIKWAKETIYNSFPKKIILKKWANIAEETFEKSSLILPICKYLGEIVKQRYPDKKVEVMYQGIEPLKWYPEK